MTFSRLITAVIVAYSLGALAYVYRYRGTTRYVTLEQYLRKSWPIFAPLNCLLYMATHGSARKPVLHADYLKNIAVLRDNWQTIRDEALTPEDERGLFSAIFSALAPIQERALRLRAQRRWLYNVCKFSLNMTLLAALALIPLGVLRALEAVLRG